MMQKICDEFHKLYERKRIWENTSWLGVPMWKFPFDALIIQELIFKVKPEYIVETGTNYGGAALFYATILDLIDNNVGTVITIDKVNKIKIDNPMIKRLFDRRIVQLTGDSVDEETVKIVKSYCNLKKTMVILDSWHSKEHVLKELKMYSGLVSLGSYLIVEDSHVNNHPIHWQYGKGPYEAVKEFLKHNHSFVIDKKCEKLLITFNPNGYLKKVLHG